MAANTTNKNLTVPDSGTLSGAWAAPVNTDWTLIDAALGNALAINATGLTTQTMSSNFPNTYSYIPMSLRITNAINNNVTFVIPSGVGGQWIVRNDTTDGTGGPWTVTFASAGGGASAVVERGISTLIYSDGTNIRYSDNRTRAALAGGSSTQVQYNNSTALAGNAAFIFDSTTGYVGIGNTSPAPTTPSHPLTVKGIIRTTYSSGTTGGGIQFPDGTVQTSAAVGPPTSFVASIDFGSTGLLPSIPSVGAVTVGGVLGAAYGGTGITALGTGVSTALGQAVTGSGGMALAASPTFTGTATAATFNTTGNISCAGTITLNTGGVTTGTALSLRKGGNLVFYNAADTGSVGVACDTNGELGTDGNFVAAGSIKALTTGFIFPDGSTQATAFAALASGRQVFPSGLVMQWGYSNVAGTSRQSVTFNAAFPTGCVAVLTQPQSNIIYSGGPYALDVDQSTLSTTKFDALNNNSFTVGFWWFAIGY
jgi:hypothetical protein